MKSKLAMSLLSVFCLIVFTGCPQPPGTHLPLAFDPTGTWLASNNPYTGVSVDYYSRSTTKAFFAPEALDGVDESFFGTTDPVLGTPTVYSSAPTVSIEYAPSSKTAYMNISGTGGTVLNNSDYIAIPSDGSMKTVPINPSKEMKVPFLGSNGCIYNYSVYLSVSFNTSNELSGYVSTRFDFEDDFSKSDEENPSCAEIFAVFQQDFDRHEETFEKDGLLYALFYLTVNGSAGLRVPAIDTAHISSISGFQFDSGFSARRTSLELPSLSEPNSKQRHSELIHIGDISAEFIEAKAVDGGKAFAQLFRNWDRILSKK